MKKKQILILIIFSLFFSCTERIDFELNDGDNNRLVVEGGITSEYTKHRIKLSRTTSYFANQETPRELNAEVSVTDGDTTIFFTDENNDGIYETDSVAGKLEKNYELNIKLQDGEVYTASAYMNPLDTQIDQLLYLYTDTLYDYSQNFYYYIFLFVQEPVGIGDYYIFDLYIDNVLQTDTLREKTYMQDELIDGAYLEFIDIFAIPKNQLVNDITMVGVKMSSAPKERFEYHIAVLFETDFRGGMFDGPPANIPTNISGSALGYFWTSDVNYFEIPVFYQQD